MDHLNHYLVIFDIIEKADNPYLLKDMCLRSRHYPEGVLAERVFDNLCTFQNDRL